MRKIKLYIAASIDGYIADIDGGLDWLSPYPITPELNYGYDEFFNSVDSVIMGGRTYHVYSFAWGCFYLPYILTK